MSSEINPKFDPLRYYTVTGNGVRLRAYPSTSDNDDSLIGQLYKGDVVHNIKNSAGEYYQEKYGYTWVYVEVISATEKTLVGKKGYVADNYLSNSQTE